MDDRAQHDAPPPAKAGPQPFSHTFWSPEVKGQRTAYFKIIFRGMLLVCIVILTVLALYWGALWDIANGIHNLNAAIIDFDGGAIGQVVTETFVSASGPKTQLDYYPVGAAGFGTPDAVKEAVRNERYWAAIVINPNATQKLQNAINTVDGSYNGTLAATIYYSESRNENAAPSLLVPNLESVMKMAQMQFSLQNARSVATNANLAQLLGNAPQTVAAPLEYVLYNITPFNQTVGAAVDFVGLIYLLILAFILTMMHYAARMQSGLERQLTTKSLVLSRIGVAIFMYFWVSLVYSFLSLMFKVSFRHYYGNAGFFIYWMLDWIGMTGLGLAVEAVITILTPAFTPFFLVLMIIVNVAVCFYPIEVLPTIYRYGYAMPFYNISLTVRAIVFGTRNTIGLNFGILLAWVVVSLITIPLFQWFVRRRDMKKAQAAQRPNGNEKA